jgi:hypothetical protein
VFDINGGNLVAIDATPASGYGSNPSLTITNTATVNEQDFTITQAGTFDASLALSSAGTGADAIAISAGTSIATAGGIDIDAYPAVGLSAPTLVITNNSAAVDQDLRIEQKGAVDASLLLSSTGTGADAIELDASAGDISIKHAAGKKVLFNTNIAGTISHTSDGATEDLTIEQLGAYDASLALSSAGTGVDAIAISAGTSIATAGGIDIDAYPAVGLSAPTLVITNNSAAVDQDLRIEQKGAVDASLLLSSTGTGADAIELDASAGDISIKHAAGKKVLFNTNIAGTISHTSDGATEDLTIEQLGAYDASLALSSAGTGVDAIAISASAGGIDITATGNADTEDLDITTVGTTTELRLTSASTEADAIELDAEAGGIIAKVFDGKTLQLSNAGNDTYIKLNAHETPANETIEIMNAVGTGSGSIAFTSSAGGVDINGGTGVNVDGTGISIDGTTASNFTVTGPGANLTLAAAGGGTQQLVLGSAGTDAEAINIDASGTGGGIAIDAVGDISMNATNITHICCHC